MDIFEIQLAKAKTLTSQQVSTMLFEFIRSIEKELVDLNREQINEKSQDIYGNAIGFYSRATEIITGGSKKAGEPFDGDSTGEWLRRFYMQVNGDTLGFGSSDSKTDLILESDNWLSKDLFGLTDENLNNVIETRLLPFIQNYYAKTLGI